MKAILFVFLGGGTGSIARYLLGKLFDNSNNGFPYGTFVSNILGSLVIGFILGWALKNNTLNSHTTLLLTTGFCGGFTTFSTFAYENQAMLKSGDFTLFAVYAIATFAIGIFSVFGGIELAKMI